MQTLAITKDKIAGAETYLPLAQKEKIAQEIAQACLTSITVQMTVGNIPIELPDYNGTDGALRARYLTGALYKFYLKIPFEPVEGTDFLLSLDDYDRAGRTHPLNTIERFKSDRDTKDKCFDLLRDYKELTELCRGAASDVLAARNDPVLRYLAAQAMTITPEALNQLSKAEKQLRKETEKLRRSGAQAQEAIREHGERLDKATGNRQQGTGERIATDPAGPRND